MRDAKAGEEIEREYRQRPLARWWEAGSALRRDRNTCLIYLNMALQGLVAAGATAYLSVFAVRLGASTFLIGLLSSLPSLVLVLSAMPAGRFVNRQRRLVPVAARSYGLIALAYVAIALVPLCAPGWAGAAIVLIWAVAAIPNGVFEVSMTAALAEAIPAARRATVISTRFAIHSIVAAIALPQIGRLLDSSPFPLGYQIVFFTSFAAALLSALVFSRIELPDLPPRPLAPKERPWRRLRSGLSELVSQRAILIYLISLTLFRFGLTVPRPLFSVFWVNHLHLRDSDIAMATTTVYVLSVIGYFLWGRLANRHGHVPVLVASTIGLAMYPLITSLAQSLAVIILASCFGGFFTSGLTLATFNVLLALAPPDKRGDYVALNAISVNVTALIGPILGSALADAIGIREALLIGAAMRLLGGLLFVVKPVREG